MPKPIGGKRRPLEEHDKLEFHLKKESRFRRRDKRGRGRNREPAWAQHAGSARKIRRRALQQRFSWLNDHLFEEQRSTYYWLLLGYEVSSESAEVEIWHEEWLAQQRSLAESENRLAA